STTGIGAPWVRNVPYQYPDTNISTNLYAKTLSIQPAGNLVIPNNPILFEYAIVTVNFGIMTWNAQAGDDPFFLNSISQDPTENRALQFCTQDVTFGHETIPLPWASATFPDGTKLKGPVTKKISVTTMSLTWHRVPYMPMPLLRNYQGNVNTATFL